MFAIDAEHEALIKLCKEYIEKGIRWGDSYSLYGLIQDINDDHKFLHLSSNDVDIICQDEYDAFFMTPCNWGH